MDKIIDFLKEALTPAQLLGYVAMACCLLSYQCKKNKHYFFMQTACGIAFTLHFFLLGAWSAMLLNAVAAVRGVFFSLGDKFHKQYIHLSIQVALLLCSILSVTVFGEVWWIAICIFLAQSGGTLSQWTRNGKTIRMTQMLWVSPFWLINNFYYFTIGGILTESFNILSVLISMLRFHKTGYDKT